MDTTRKAMAVATANVVWMFVVSTVLAWAYTGSLDLKLVQLMAAMLLPLLIIAIGILLFVEFRAHRRRQQVDSAGMVWTKSHETL